MKKLERQTVYRLSRQDKQLERRFREHTEAEPAKNAPSQELEASFAGTTEAKLIGALDLVPWALKCRIVAYVPDGAHRCASARLAP
jgi:hypothetical protein